MTNIKSLIIAFICVASGLLVAFVSHEPESPKINHSVESKALEMIAIGNDSTCFCEAAEMEDPNDPNSPWCRQCGYFVNGGWDLVIYTQCLECRYCVPGETPCSDVYWEFN